MQCVMQGPVWKVYMQCVIHDGALVYAHRVELPSQTAEQHFPDYIQLLESVS